MRATNGAARHRMIKRIQKRARGYHSGRHKMYRVMCEALRRADVQAFASRKQKKRTFRSLWIKRISIACRAEGVTYSRLISGLALADIRLDRKQLSELAIHQPEAFNQIVAKVAAILKAAPASAAASAPASPSIPSGIKGYFEKLTAKDGRHYFNLKAGNHEIILTGEMLASAAAVDAVISQVQARASAAAAYTTATATNGEVFFTLTAANGSTLGRSETYPTDAILVKGRESVQRNGPTTKIVSH